ncbi:hypothetical protein BESB_079370 [Besnoitia besnoiti]|uniref:Uncharacterized protein n=1 Tax=Besnoitia besnoiti TaxID=94643 RepID=A0A2A9MBM7_BESBE|nr:hypothetical protein BESB_079370 [Besnoitia besnoiti]PFH33721.1 hypothetical protein BESB_079370 [Besnoitia besnoiti]
MYRAQLLRKLGEAPTERLEASTCPTFSSSSPGLVLAAPDACYFGSVRPALPQIARGAPCGAPSQLKQLAEPRTLLAATFPLLSRSESAESSPVSYPSSAPSAGACAPAASSAPPADAAPGVASAGTQTEPAPDDLQGTAGLQPRAGAAKETSGMEPPLAGVDDFAAGRSGAEEDDVEDLSGWPTALVLDSDNEGDTDCISKGEEAHTEDEGCQVDWSTADEKDDDEQRLSASVAQIIRGGGAVAEYSRDAHAEGGASAKACGDAAEELCVGHADCTALEFCLRSFRRRVFLPRSKRLPGHQTVIIFDWDDTLLCTSFLNVYCRSPDWRVSVVEHLETIQRHGKALLELAMKMGHVFIVTNAVEGWVEHSSRRFLPGLLPVLAKLPVISARNRYEAVYPGAYHLWKVHAFLEVRRQLDREINTNLISVGDSDIEMDAVHVMGKEFAQAVVKTVKFRENPSPEELAKQLELVTSKFEKICLSACNLTIGLEKQWDDSSARRSQANPGDPRLSSFSPAATLPCGSSFPASAFAPAPGLACIDLSSPFACRPCAACPPASFALAEHLPSSASAAGVSQGAARSSAGNMRLQPEFIQAPNPGHVSVKSTLHALTGKQPEGRDGGAERGAEAGQQTGKANQTTRAGKREGRLPAGEQVRGEFRTMHTTRSEYVFDKAALQHGESVAGGRADGDAAGGGASLGVQALNEHFLARRSQPILSDRVAHVPLRLAREVIRTFPEHLASSPLPSSSSSSPASSSSSSSSLASAEDSPPSAASAAGCSLSAATPSWSAPSSASALPRAASLSETPGAAGVSRAAQRGRGA